LLNHDPPASRQNERPASRDDWIGAGEHHRITDRLDQNRAIREQRFGELGEAGRDFDGRFVALCFGESSEPGEVGEEDRLIHRVHIRLAGTTLTG
jgi:hypothetical protein